MASPYLCDGPKETQDTSKQYIDTDIHDTGDIPLMFCIQPKIWIRFEDKQLFWTKISRQVAALEKKIRDLVQFFKSALKILNQRYLSTVSSANTEIAFSGDNLLNNFTL